MGNGVDLPEGLAAATIWNWRHGELDDDVVVACEGKKVENEGK